MNFMQLQKRNVVLVCFVFHWRSQLSAKALNFIVLGDYELNVHLTHCCTFTLNVESALIIYKSDHDKTLNTATFSSNSVSWDAQSSKVEIIVIINFIHHFHQKVRSCDYKKYILQYQSKRIKSITTKKITPDAPSSE